MPFGSQASLDFFDSLPPLDGESRAPGGSSSTQPGVSLFEGLAALAPRSQRQLYRLCLLDEATGQPAAYPSDDDLQRLIEGGPAAARRSPPAAPATGAGAPRAAAAAAAAAAAVVQLPPTAAQQGREPTFQEMLAAHIQRGGPMCQHCGVTESPQWRRGPPNKPILCNACGTRYRRTNQLGSAVPSAQRKRQAQHQQQGQHCGGEALKHHGPVAKQARVSVA